MNKYQKILTIAALIIFSAIPCSFANDFNWNGNWWRTQPKIVKAIYVSGMRAGVYGGIVMLGAEGDLAAMDSLQSSATRFVDFRTEQIVDGMNRLYSDNRNLDIDSSCAFHIVELQLIGAPESQIRKLIKISKEAAAEFKQKEQTHR